MKKSIALVLSVVMFLSLFTPTLASTVENDAVTLTASSTNPISISKKETLPDEYDSNGILDLMGGHYSIGRDYAQACSITVKNTAETSVEYFLTVKNVYSDIYLNFVRSGSAEIPLVIAAGETQQIQMDVFTQNAEESEYTLPIYAHVVEDESEFVDSMTTAFLNVPTVNLNVSFTKKSTDSNTLAQVYALTNKGAAVSDLSVLADDTLKDYVFFSPSYENYSLNRGETIEFTVSPNLYKMKINNIARLEGQLIACSGGSQSSIEVVFDTEGKEITTMTMGEVVEMQMGKTSGLETQDISVPGFRKPTEDHNTKGNQCTNAGKVATNFYVSPQSQQSAFVSADDSENTGVRVFLTSRMYGGEYVNRAETNYDYYINGELVSRSHNSGLTEVSIAELPTDKIKFGATNTIIRDYDTNPGSHFVTADTTITIAYPESTPISFIGSPDTLPDYRPLPDFAVFSENIFCEDANIIKGVKTNLSANIYNLGYNAGTIDIEVLDGSDVIYHEENRTIDGFSGDVISFEWTPTKTDNNITVHLINKTEGIPEKSEDNNVASHVFKTRQRQVPVINSITPDYAVVGESIVYATVLRYADVTRVEFYVDGVLYAEEVSGSEYGGAMRYWINKSDLSEGAHTIRVLVYYINDNDEEVFVESSKDFSVLPSEWDRYTFTVDDSLTGISCVIFDEIGGTNRNIYGLTRSGNQCTINLTKSEYDNPENHTLFVVSGDSVLFKPLSDDSAFTKESGNTVELRTNGAMIINSVYLRSVNGNYVNASFYNRSVLTLTPAAYEFEIELNYMGEYRSVRAQADLTSGDQIIDLTDSFTQFDFCFADEMFGEPSVNVYAFDSTGEKQLIRPLATLNDNELLAVVSKYDQAAFDSSERVIICVKTKDVLFVADAKTIDKQVIIDKSKLQKYNLSAGDFSITEVEVACEDFTETLYAPTVYITPGEYDITAYCKDLGENVMITGAYTGIRYVPQKEESTESAFAVNASSAYDRYLSIYAVGSAGDVISNDKYFSGDSIIAKQDTYQTNLNLNRNSATYTVTAQINTASVDNLKVGNEFSGLIANSFGSYEGYSEVTLYLTDLKDSYQNRLTAFNAKDESDNLSGELIFTNTENETERHSVWVTVNNLSSISVMLPDIEGDYNLQLVLSNGEQVNTLKGISMARDRILMFCNRSYTVSVQMHPGTYERPKLIWTSSDESVATVDENGVITSAYEDIGTTIITAQTEDGSYVAQCEVIVCYNIIQLVRKLVVEIYRAVKQSVYPFIESVKTLF